MFVGIVISVFFIGCECVSIIKNGVGVIRLWDWLIKYCVVLLVVSWNYKKWVIYIVDC